MDSFCANCQKVTEDDVIRSIWPTNKRLIQVTKNCRECTLMKSQGVEEADKHDC